MSLAETEARVRSALDEVVGRLILEYPDEPRFDRGAAGRAPEAARIVPLYRGDAYRTGPGGRPHPSRRRRHRIVAVAAVVVSVVAAATGLGLSWTSSGGPSAAAAVLTEAARHAAMTDSTAPGPGQYLYEETVTDRLIFETSDGHQWYVDLPSTDQVWLGTDGSGRLILTPGTPTFPSDADRAAWQAAGSPSLGQTTGFDQTVASMPVIGVPGTTGSTTQGMAGALRDAALIAAGNSIGQAVLPYPDVASLSTDPATLLQQLVDRYEGGVRDDETTFSMAASLLEEGTSPAQRSAIYTMLASLPGVEVDGAVTVGATNRAGTALTMSGPNEPCTVVVVPSTSDVLEQRCATIGGTQSPASAVPSGTTAEPSVTPAVEVSLTTVYQGTKVVGSPASGT